MELIRGLHNLRRQHRGCVATIGNFDGVHLGHRHVLSQLQQAASEHGLPSLVMTFEPTPREYFAPEAAPVRLTALRDKLEALQQSEVERVLCLRFDARLANMPAPDFIREVLVEQLGVRHLVVGDDFRFGRKRQGDFAMLEQAGGEYGFDVERMGTREIDGARVSSTRIREALAQGQLDLAARLLGRPYTLSGRVVRGKQLGRELGYPTANIPLARWRSAVAGIYAVRVACGDEVHTGVASVGTRPTVNDDETVLLEVHLFDFDGDLYSRRLWVRFEHWLRPEEKFDDLDTLIAQMQRDEAVARAWFATGPAPTIKLDRTGK